MCLIGMIRLRSNEHQLHLKNKDFEKKKRFTRNTNSLSGSCYWTSIKAQDVSNSHLAIPDLNRSKTVHRFLITCLISLPAVFFFFFFFSVSHNLFCSLQVPFLTPARNPHWPHHLFPSPSSYMFCPLPQRTYCIQQTISLQHTPRHLYASSLRGSASIEYAVRRPSQLPEVELPPFPWEFTMQYPCVWRECVYVWVCCIFIIFFFPFNGIAMLCSEIGSTMGVQEGHYWSCYFVDLGGGFSIPYCIVFHIGNIDYYCHCVLIMVLYSKLLEV